MSLQVPHHHSRSRAASLAFIPHAGGHGGPGSRRNSVLDLHLSKPGDGGGGSLSPPVMPPNVFRRASIAAMAPPAPEETKMPTTPLEAETKFPTAATVKSARRHSIAAFAGGDGEKGAKRRRRSSFGVEESPQLYPVDQPPPSDLFNTTSPFGGFGSFGFGKESGQKRPVSPSKLFDTASPFGQPFGGKSSQPFSLGAPLDLSPGHSPGGSPGHSPNETPASSSAPSEAGDDVASPGHLSPRYKRGDGARSSSRSPAGSRNRSPQGRVSPSSVEQRLAQIQDPQRAKALAEMPPTLQNSPTEEFDDAPLERMLARQGFEQDEGMMDEDEQMTDVEIRSISPTGETAILSKSPPKSASKLPEEKPAESEDRMSMLYRLMGNDQEEGSDDEDESAADMFNRMRQQLLKPEALTPDDASETSSLELKRSTRMEQDDDEIEAAEEEDEEEEDGGAPLQRQSSGLAMPQDFDLDMDDSASESSADSVEDVAPLFETVLVLANSIPDHRCALARALPEWLHYVELFQAVEHVLPMMNRLAQDDTNIRFGLAEGVDKIMLFFAERCPFGDGAVDSALASLAIPHDAFTPILGALLLDDEDKVSIEARHALIRFFCRLNELPLPQYKHDPKDLRPPPLPVPKPQERPHKAPLMYKLTSETKHNIQANLLTDVVIGLGHFDPHGNSSGVQTPVNVSSSEVNRGRKVAIELMTAILDNKAITNDDILDVFTPEILRFKDHPDSATRALVATSLAALAKVSEPKTVEKKLLPTFHILLKDRDARVRKATCSVAGPVFSRLPEALQKPEATLLLQHAQADQKMEVRLALAQQMGQLMQLAGENSKNSDLLSWYLHTLPNSFDPQLVKACAYNFPAVLYTLGANQWNLLKDLHLFLSQSDFVFVRNSVADSLPAVAQMLDAKVRIHDIEPVFFELLVDQAPETQEIMLLNSLAFISLLPAPTIHIAFRKVFQNVNHTVRYQVRQALAMEMQKYCSALPKGKDSVFWKLLEVLMKDEISLVKMAAIDALVMAFKEARTPDEIDVVLEFLVSHFAKGPNYRYRATFVRSINKLLQAGLRPDVFEKYLLDHLVMMTNDVCNVRLGLANIVQYVTTNALYYTANSYPQQVIQLQTELKKSKEYSVQNILAGH